MGASTFTVSFGCACSKSNLLLNRVVANLANCVVANYVVANLANCVVANCVVADLANCVVANRVVANCVVANLARADCVFATSIYRPSVLKLHDLVYQEQI